MVSNVTMFAESREQRAESREQRAESREQRAESREPYYLLTYEESERLNILKLWLSIMVVFIHSARTEIHFRGEDVTFDVPVWLETFKYLISSAISRCAVPGLRYSCIVSNFRGEQMSVRRSRLSLCRT